MGAIPEQQSIQKPLRRNGSHRLTNQTPIQSLKTIPKWNSHLIYIFIFHLKTILSAPLALLTFHFHFAINLDTKEYLRKHHLHLYLSIMTVSVTVRYLPMPFVCRRASFLHSSLFLWIFLWFRNCISAERNVHPHSNSTAKRNTSRTKGAKITILCDRSKRMAASANEVQIKIYHNYCRLLCMTRRTNPYFQLDVEQRQNKRQLITFSFGTLIGKISISFGG